jgi:predicted nucleic acid-binding protein
MILVDTSVWIDHLRRENAILTELLNQGRILTHPFVIGELALGNLKNRDTVLHALQLLPQANVANSLEVLKFIQQQNLFGLGIGYVDSHLIAAVRLTPGCLLWTFDKRLRTVATTASVHADLPTG